MAPRLQIADHSAVLDELLLKPTELMDRTWEPDVPLADFFHTRLRPSIYFLQRCLVGDEGLEGEAIDIPPEEMVIIHRHMVAAMGTIRLLARAWFDGVNALKRAIRANVAPSSGVADAAAKYFILGESCNMFSIVQHLMNRVDFEYWWAPALDTCKSLVIDFWLLAQNNARRPGGCTEYPEFDGSGILDADGLRSSPIARILIPITSVRRLPYYFSPGPIVPVGRIDTGCKVHGFYDGIDGECRIGVVESRIVSFRGDVAGYIGGSEVLVRPSHEVRLRDIRRSLGSSVHNSSDGWRSGRISPLELRFPCPAAGIREPTDHEAGYGRNPRASSSSGRPNSGGFLLLLLEGRDREACPSATDPRLFVQCHDLVSARRLPVPRISSLRMVMRAASSYGFAGNEDPLVAAALQGKLA
ncbi:hypothetical protein FB451DRAFT_1191110 [Mycena latifolia]|nr:hypothetical protein FB451DRAFT_1191110 [Mycena latifolia]